MNDQEQAQQAAADAVAQAEKQAAAEKEAKTKGKAKADNSHLIPMTKNGEALDVHPSCVADHQRLGWKARE